MMEKLNTFSKEMILSFLIPIIYYIIINFLIHQFSNIAIYDTLSDMVIIIPCFMILFYTLKYHKGKVKVYLFVGTLLIIINKMVELVLQELIIKEIYGFWSIWIILIYMNYMGIYSLFFGFRRLHKYGN